MGKSNSMSLKDASKKSFSTNYHSMTFIFDEFASYDITAAYSREFSIFGSLWPEDQDERVSSRVHYVADPQSF